MSANRCEAIVVNDEWFQSQGGVLIPFPGASTVALNVPQGYTESRILSVSRPEYGSVGVIQGSSDFIGNILGISGSTGTGTLLGHRQKSDGSYESFILTAGHVSHEAQTTLVEFIDLSFSVVANPSSSLNHTELFDNRQPFDSNVPAFRPAEATIPDIFVVGGAATRTTQGTAIATDISIVVVPELLTSPPGTPAPFIYYGDRERNRPVDLVGYGQWGTRATGLLPGDTPSDAEDRRAYGANVISGTSDASVVGSTTNPTLAGEPAANRGYILNIQFDNPGSTTYQDREAISGPGDSGSAWWQNFAGVTAITGVTSAGNNSSSSAVRVSQFASWIEQLFPEVRTLDKPIEFRSQPGIAASFIDDANWVGGQEAVFDDRAVFRGISQTAVIPSQVPVTTFGLEIDGGLVVLRSDTAGTTANYTVREVVEVTGNAYLQVGSGTRRLNLGVGEMLLIDGGSNIELFGGQIRANTLAGDGNLFYRGSDNTLILGENRARASLNERFDGDIQPAVSATIQIIKRDSGAQTFGGTVTAQDFLLQGGSLVASGSGANLTATNLISIQDQTLFAVDSWAAVSAGIAIVEDQGHLRLDASSSFQTGTLETRRGGTIDLRGGLMTITNRLDASGGVLNHQGGRLVVDSATMTTASADYNLGSSAELVVRNGSIVTAGGRIMMSGDQATVSIESGSRVSASDFRVGDAGVSGELIVEPNAELATANFLWFGRGGGAGAGSLAGNVNVSGSLVIDNVGSRVEIGPTGDVDVNDQTYLRLGATLSMQGGALETGRFLSEGGGGILEYLISDFSTNAVSPIVALADAVLDGTISLILGGNSYSLGQEPLPLITTVSGITGAFDQIEIQLNGANLNSAISPSVLVTNNAVLLALAPTLTGDFNADGVVDAADYTVWRDSLGRRDVVPFTSGDANGDSTVDGTDYGLWTANFGATLPSSALQAVPEPATVILTIGMAAATTRQRRLRA